MPVNRRSVYISTLNKDSGLLVQSRKLQRCLSSREYLDEVGIRKFLENNDSAVWEEILEDVKRVVVKNSDQDLVQVKE